MARAPRCIACAPAQDTDEFLLLNCASIGEYVDQLQAKHGAVDLIQWRWALYEHLRPYCSELPLEQMLRAPPGALPNAHVKSMTKVFPGLILDHPHRPLLPRDKHYVRVLDGRAQRVLGHEVGYSAADAPLPYRESALLHVHTRSIADLLTKATYGLPIHGRQPITPDLLRLLITGRPSRGHALIHQFYKAAGTKAQLPAAHVGTGLVKARELNVSLAYTGERVAALLAAMNASAGSARRTRGMCDQRIERAEFRNVLSALNVSFERFGRFAADLEQAFQIRFSAMSANYRSGGSPWGRRLVAHG